MPLCNYYFTKGIKAGMRCTTLTRTDRKYCGKHSREEYGDTIQEKNREKIDYLKSLNEHRNSYGAKVSQSKVDKQEVIKPATKTKPFFDLEKEIDEALHKEFIGDDDEDNELPVNEERKEEPLIEPTKPVKKVKKDESIKELYKPPTVEPTKEPVKKVKKDYNTMSEKELTDLLSDYIPRKDKKAQEVLKAMKAKGIIDDSEYKALFIELM